MLTVWTITAGAKQRAINSIGVKWRRLLFVVNAIPRWDLSVCLCVSAKDNCRQWLHDAMALIASVVAFIQMINKSAVVTTAAMMVSSTMNAQSFSMILSLIECVVHSSDSLFTLRITTSSSIYWRRHREKQKQIHTTDSRQFIVSIVRVKIHGDSDKHTFEITHMNHF